MHLPPAGRLAAIDPGTRRVGIAVSDEMRMIARPLPYVNAEGLSATAKRVHDALIGYDVALVFVGRARHMHGGDAQSAQKSEALARELEKLGLACRLVDERLSTVAARRQLKESGKREHAVRELVDSESAAVLLQAELDAVCGPPDVEVR